MSRFKKLSSIAKTLGISAAAGYVGARVTSTSHEANDNARAGAIMATTIAAGAIIAGKSIKPLGKMVFRKIRGRIVPIRVKK